MNTAKQLILPLLAIMFSSGNLYAADPVVRLTCEAKHTGAEVSVNGKFRGACPLDLVVKEGTLKIALTLPRTKELQLEYRKQVRIGDGVVMRVHIPEAGWRRTYTESYRATIKDFPANFAAAKGGDKLAMYEVGKAYAYGLGVAEDSQQALIWLSKAAKAGVPAAMRSLADLYESSFDLPNDEEKSLAWTRRAVAADPNNKLLQELLQLRTELFELNTSNK